MTFDSRERARLVPECTVADSAYRVRAINPRQLSPKYVDVGHFQGNVDRAGAARMRVDRCGWPAGLRRIVATTAGVRYFSQAVAPLSIQVPLPATTDGGAVNAIVPITTATVTNSRRLNDCMVMVLLDRPDSKG